MISLAVLGPALLPGHPAPGFPAVDSEGMALELDALCRTTILLDSCASRCIPCLIEIEPLKRLHRTYADRLMVLGIDLDGNEVTFPEAVDSFDIPRRQVYDGVDGPIAALYRVSGIPDDLRGGGRTVRRSRVSVRTGLALLFLLGPVTASIAQQPILGVATEPAPVILPVGGRTAMRVHLENRSLYEADDVMLFLPEREGLDIAPTEPTLERVPPFATAEIVVELLADDTLPPAEIHHSLNMVYTYCIDDSCYQIVETLPLEIRVVPADSGTPAATVVLPYARRRLPVWIPLAALGIVVGLGLVWRIRRGSSGALRVALAVVVLAGLAYGVTLDQHEQAQGIGAVLCTSCVGIEDAIRETPTLSPGDLARIDGIDRDIELIVFYAPWCHACPYAEALVTMIAEASPRVSHRLVDVEAEPETASVHGIIRTGRTVVPAVLRVDTGDVLFGVDHLKARMLDLLEVSG